MHGRGRRWDEWVRGGEALEYEQVGTKSDEVRIRDRGDPLGDTSGGDAMRERMLTGCILISLAENYRGNPERAGGPKVWGC